MSGQMIISPLKDAFHIDPDTFRSEAERRWAPHIKVTHFDGKVPVWTAGVSRPNEPRFMVQRYDNSPMIGIEASEAQEIEVAVWVRSLVAPNVPLWLINGDYTAHVELPPGITENELWAASWIEHDEDFVDPLEDQ